MIECITDIDSTNIKKIQLGLTTMKLLYLFKSCLTSALSRQCLQEKWICDQSLVTILQDDYGLNFVNKRYINKYLPGIYLNEYKCYHLRINGIKNNNKKVMNVTFYHFSKASSPPKSLSTKFQWEEVYNNFRLLRSRRNTTNINKRKIIQYRENNNQD